MTWEQLITIISVAGTLCAIVFGGISAKRASTKDTRAEALNTARIEEKLDTANHGIEDVRIEIRAQAKQLSDHATRIARCEESCKSAHHRIDRLEGHTEE